MTYIISVTSAVFQINAIFAVRHISEYKLYSVYMQLNKKIKIKKIFFALKRSYHLSCGYGVKIW